MKMFSNCSGECCVCSSGGFCLAGHGDDDFSPASKEKIIENLDEGKYPNYTEYMIKYLANEYGYIYNIKNVGRKKKEKQLKNEQPVEESFGGFTWKVVAAGNCVSCGKRIDDDSIFLCKNCQSKQNAEGVKGKRESITREEIIKHLEYLKIAAEMDAKPESINAEILGAAIQELKSDTISRQVVLDILEDNWNRFLDPEDAIQESISTIEALTPVTPQPKTGRWIDDKCSVCGKGIEDLISSPEWYRNEEPNFCPFCGVNIQEVEK